MLIFEIISDEPLYCYAFLGSFALLANIFAFARGKATEEGLEISIAAIDKMKLAVFARSKA